MAEAEGKGKQNYSVHVRIHRNQGEDDPWVEVADDKTLSVVLDAQKRRRSLLTVDQVHDNSSQHALFESLVQPCLQTIERTPTANVFIAYGASGTGKTFSVLGKEGIKGQSPTQAGLLPTTVAHLFRTHPGASIHVAAIELYLTQAQDLLKNKKIKQFVSDFLL